jgi:hypothetical protein
VPAHYEALRELNTKRPRISQRRLEYFITKYAHHYGVGFQRGTELVSIYQEYRAKRRRYTKRYFDVFRRGNLLKLEAADKSSSLQTSVAQMNFIRWTLQRGILEYAIQHQYDIRPSLSNQSPAIAMSPLSASAPVQRLNSSQEDLPAR